MNILIIHDLNLPIEEGMPYFKGDPIPEIRQFKNIRKDGYNIKEIRMGTHTGTHLDAPSHFIDGGKTIDQLDISDLRGRGICISYDPRKALELPEEHYDIVLLYTGYNNDWKNFKTFENFSYIKGEDAKKLRDYGVRLVGIDSPSAEIQNSTDFETHHILLGASIPIAENLNSIPLSKLVGHSFEVEVMPIMVKDGDGAPARIIALEE